MRNRVPLRPQLDVALEKYGIAAKANYQGFITAAAMGAIGLGSLSLAPALCAEIVYTPTNKVVGVVSGASRLPIDLNNDGVADLSISAYNFLSFSSGDHIIRDLDALGLRGNQIRVVEGDLAVPAVTGQAIGPGSALTGFATGAVMAYSRFSGGDGSTFSASKGLWFNTTNRYLGVKFAIEGEIHYGWARFNASAGYAKLTGYAYETVPNKPIPAGVFETAPEESNAPAQRETLGELATGAMRR